MKKTPKLQKGQHWVRRKDGVVQRYTFKGKKRLSDFIKTGERKGRAFIYEKKTKEETTLLLPTEETKPRNAFFRCLLAVSYSSDNKKHGLEDLRVWVHETEIGKWTNRDLYSKMWEFAIETVGIPSNLGNSLVENREEIDREILESEVQDENDNNGSVGVVYGYLEIKGYVYRGNNAGGQWRFKRD